tara:strand:- start:795 stop:2834 length:2040 start_codon:yes stop_codon:yes gene_type:complete
MKCKLLFITLSINIGDCLLSKNYNFVSNKKSINRRMLPVVNINSINSNNMPSEIIRELSKTSREPGSSWTYQTFLDNLKESNIDKVSIFSNEKGFAIIDNNHDKGDILASNIHIVNTIPNMITDLVSQLNLNHIGYDIYNIADKQPGPLDFLSGPLQFVSFYLVGTVVLNVLLNIFRSSTGTGGMNTDMNNPLSMFKQTNVLIDTENIDVTFDDVAGCDEAKFELMEVVDFLKNPLKYQEVGAKIPSGVLLEGDPGTGKTLLARAVAGEAGVSFLSASGSEFIEMFVGVGASRVRKLFEKAKDNTPCVIFIDEIDAIGRQRGAGVNTGNDEREQTLNQILTNMDGFAGSEGIIVIAATNRADILDSALLRPGRFDRKVKVPLPDLEGRGKIFSVHTRNKLLSDDISINEVSLLTGGFSGADLENLANEAAILTARTNKTMIDRKAILDAYEKITIGLPYNSKTVNPKELSLVAHHEIGHAMMAKYFEEFFELRKVTINANTGGAGGYTLFTPKEFYTKYPTKKFMLANIVTALGGRAAEVKLFSNNKKQKTDIVFKGIKNLDITTGASNDLKQADRIARQYISLFGYSDDELSYNCGGSASEGTQPFLGRELGMGGDRTSEYSKELLDKKVSELISDSYNIALQIIESNTETFNSLGKKLIEDKILNGKDFDNIDLVYN